VGASFAFLRAVLAAVQELEQRDAAVAAAIEAVTAVERSLEELRARAAEAAEELARLPGDRARVAEAREAAARAVDEARAELGAADEERGAAAQRALELAEAQAAEAAAAVSAVERRAAAAAVERDRVDDEARLVSDRLSALERIHEVEPPSAGLAGALDWTSRARAAVFVARSGLEQERERIVREAEELGAALLGEQVYTVKALVDRLL
jgi:chromosome segregation ATPase